MAISRARDTAVISGRMNSTAEFDYHISVNGIGGGPYSELGNEVYLLANAHLPEVTPGVGEEELDRRTENARLLMEQLMPEFSAYEKRCKQRKYRGWSAGNGPIRYAD